MALRTLNAPTCRKRNPKKKKKSKFTYKVKMALKLKGWAFEEVLSKSNRTLNSTQPLIHVRRDGVLPCKVVITSTRALPRHPKGVSYNEGSVIPGGARDWTETLYFLFQTLVVPSLITESKYRIQNKKYNYHRSGVHQNLYTYTESHLLIQTLIHIHV